MSAPATVSAGDVADDQVAALATGAQAPIYAAPAYHRALERMTGGRIVRAGERDPDTGALRGALTWLEHAHPDAGTVLNALPWFGSHGGPLVDPGLAPAARDAVAGRLAAAFARALDAPGVLSGALVLGLDDTGARRRAIDEAFVPQAIDERISQVTPLPPGLEDAADERVHEILLMDVFRQKTRNLVRKGVREGFVVETREDDAAWDELHALHEAGMRAIGAPVKPREHLQALRDLPEACRALWVAREGARIDAALLLLRHATTVEYVVPATRVAARSRQPMSAIVLAAMTDAVRTGARAWSWGGTPRENETLHRFKAGFGAEDRPYAVLCRAGRGGLAPLRELGPAGLVAAFPWSYAWPFARLEPTDEAEGTRP